MDIYIENNRKNRLIHISTHIEKNFCVKMNERKDSDHIN